MADNYYSSNANDSSLNSFLQGTKDFMNSNSLVSNFAFLIMVFVLFFILLQVGLQLMYGFIKHSENPKLINGMVDGSKPIIIEQNPNKGNAIPIMRSNNEQKGVEFTYSFWIFIKTFDRSNTRYRNIFYKGEDNGAASEGKYDIPNSEYSVEQGISYPNNAPGVYLHPWDNILYVYMNTYPNSPVDNNDNSNNQDVEDNDDNTNNTRPGHILEKVEISDIPMGKWVNVIVIVKNKHLDVYIGGNIAKRHVLTGVPRQNYGNVHIGFNGGFNGNLSNLYYFNHAIGTRKIEDILYDGPNTRMIGDANLTSREHDYLSTRWFLGNYDVLS